MYSQTVVKPKMWFMAKKLEDSPLTRLFFNNKKMCAVMGLQSANCAL